jgi:hypothetical protein
VLSQFFLVILGCVVFGASSGMASGASVDPKSRGVFIQDRYGAFFRVSNKIDENPGILDSYGRPIFPKDPEFAISPARMGLEHATRGGQVSYPMALTSTYDGIPERDPVGGHEYGPAGLISRFDSRNNRLWVYYSNGFYQRKKFNVQAPDFLPALEGALTDTHSNVFWISRSLNQEIRVFHENAIHRDLPLNELIFGAKIRKVRGDPAGKGIVLLLDDGRVLRVEVPEDFSLHVSTVNSIPEFKVVDLETGPLGKDPFEYSLVLFGADGATGHMGMRVYQANAIKKPYPVSLNWIDPFRRIQSVEYIKGLYGNVHAVELERLVDQHPSQLNRFLQFHYEVRQEEIQLLIRNANSNEKLPIKVGRRVILDERAPGMCRYYMMSHYGLSPDLYLN